MSVLMSGCRLNAGGLHLGHYLGCATPLRECEPSSLLVFVIGDRSAAAIDAGRKAEQWLVPLLADVLAAVRFANVALVRQSSLHDYYRAIQDNLTSLVTLTQLENVHPKQRQIRARNAALSVRDFLFPLETASTYFVLDAEYVLMNDDSARFVRFARSVAARVNNRAHAQLVRAPVLLHGPLPRLLGYNYEKVSKANGNCIFLSDTAEAVERKVEGLFAFKYLFRHSTGEAERYARERSNYALPVEFLPYSYLEAFGGITREEARKRWPTVTEQDDLKLTLKRLLAEFIDPIREEARALRESPSRVLEALEIGTSRAVHIAAAVAERFRAQSSTI